MARNDYENMVFPIPPDAEIKKIGEYIKKNDLLINKIIEKETKRIELLKEHRQSLISNVVTGKMRITEEMI